MRIVSAAASLPSLCFWSRATPIRIVFGASSLSAGASPEAANVAQTEHALLGIRLGASVYPGIALGLVLACLAAYPIGKTLNLRIQDDLVARRRGYATA